MVSRGLILGLAFWMTMTAAATGQTSPADMNCDGGVDGLDIAPFVACLVNADCAPCAPPALGLQDMIDCLLTEDCPSGVPEGMVLIPAGGFQMGDSFSEGPPSERPVHTVHVSDFYIGRHEVTNREYADALNWAWAQGATIAVTNGIVYGVGSPAGRPYCSTTSAPSGFPSYGEFSRITWDGSRFGVSAGKEDHPVGVVSWFGSAAYCNWHSQRTGRQACYDLVTWSCDFERDGYRLPTEAEWERAARGGQAGQRYPGSDSLAGWMANYYGSGDPLESGAIPSTTPVGYYDGGQTPAGPDAANGYGLYDIIGNVWEWCGDWHSNTYYAVSPSDNPRGPANGSVRIRRGGAWDCSEIYLRCAQRDGSPPGDCSGSMGFRLAMSAP